MLSGEPPQRSHSLDGDHSVQVTVRNTGEGRTVAVSPDDRSFTRYDGAAGDWVLNAGRYTLAVGRSARVTPLEVGVDAASVG